jgi:hypothetical protein
MNRGYAGYYKDVYLRSSYEYAFAKYLDFKGIKWKYEEIIFKLGFKKYKPDFFIYNEYEELQLIVEIKSRNKIAKEEALKNLQAMKEKYNIECKIVSYDELKIIYKEMPSTLTATISEWNNSLNTTINKSWNGELNPHYNQRHSEDTKKLIGDKTTKRWQDTELRKKMILGSIKGANVIKAKKGSWVKVPRVQRSCEFCGQEFIALTTSKQKFCTDVCAGRYGFKLATKSNMAEREKTHQLIKEFVLDWTSKNFELIKGTPFNRIKTNLQPLLGKIDDKFHVKDIRVITQAVLGEQLGRKELLKFLKTL